MAYHSWNPNIELAPICPRCYSSNTKFCYYNNYSLTQPRYFCKGCRRYWTKGGTLRNVPVRGGGCRKNRRGKSPKQANHPMSHGDFNYSHQDGGSKKSDLAPTEGSTIDLALIYTTFANHSSELNSDPAVPELRGEVMEESFNAMGGGAWNSAMNQMASQGLDRPGGGEITEAPFENQTYAEDGDFSLDSGCSELATFFSEGVVTGNDFILSDCWVAPPTCQGFQPALEDDVIHHQDLMLGDLCSLDQFYRF